MTQHIFQELETSIRLAIKKVSAQKETDLCYYIPHKSTQLHHLAFLKLKKKAPQELLKLIKEHILEKDNVTPVFKKPHPVSTMAKDVEIKLKRSQVNELLTVLKTAGSLIEGADDLISVLSPHQSLTQVRKFMMDMIRDKRVDYKLWETYVQLVQEEELALKNKEEQFYVH